MITYKSGNIFSEDVEAMVNTVNCVGIMGGGLALQFLERYHDNFKAYESACKEGSVKLGRMFVFQNNSEIKPKYIINFPTKKHWSDNSKIRDIENGLIALREDIKSLNIKSIAIPPMGCGLGGLKWNDVKNLINKSLNDLSDVNIIVLEPI